MCGGSCSCARCGDHTDPVCCQTKLLEDHKRSVHTLVDTAVHLLDQTYTWGSVGSGQMSTSDRANVAKQRHHLDTEVTHLDQLTSVFLTVADMLVDRSKWPASDS